MWHYQKFVLRTQTKAAQDTAWAIIRGTGAIRWLRIRPDSADGVGNVLTLLSVAQANGQPIDVHIENGEITEAIMTAPAPE